MFHIMLDSSLTALGYGSSFSSPWCQLDMSKLCVHFLFPSQSFHSSLPAGVGAAGLTLQMSRGHVKALLEGCYSQTALSGFLLLHPEGALLSSFLPLHSSQELGVSDSWCGRKVEGGDKKASEDVFSLRARHHTPASEKGVCLCVDGQSALNLLLLLMHFLLVWAIQMKMYYEVVSFYGAS